MVSRFLTAKEITQVLQQTVRERRCLIEPTGCSEDVEFKDLGLGLSTKSIASVSSTRSD
jgi:hypothetical protein